MRVACKIVCDPSLTCATAECLYCITDESTIKHYIKLLLFALLTTKTVTKITPTRTTGDMQTFTISTQLKLIHPAALQQHPSHV